MITALSIAAEAYAAKRAEAEQLGLLGIPFANYCAVEAAAYRSAKSNAHRMERRDKELPMFLQQQAG